MFNHKHYVPILRWKAAEKGALKKLDAKKREMITPLIEFVMPQPKEAAKDEEEKTPAELLEESIQIFLNTLDEIPTHIQKHWGQAMIFVDVQLIDGSIRAKALEKILKYGQQLNIFMVPTIGIIPVIGSDSDSQTIQMAINFYKKSKNNSGLCLRMSDLDFRKESITRDIENFIINNGLDKRYIDLVIDFKILNQETSNKVIAETISKIPDIAIWRTFTIANGAFPRDLSEFKKHDQYNIPRTDWIIWANVRKTLERQPSFADYTIQHPFYIQKSGAANPSASIRYTLDDNWLIMRGEGLRNPKGAGFKQYPAQAQLLAKQRIFKGADFSFGDEYIAEKAKDIETKKTGNPKTWLEAGINHHLTLVADQLSNLP